MKRGKADKQGETRVASHRNLENGLENPNLELCFAPSNIHIFIVFFNTTNHEILQISNHNLLCSLGPVLIGYVMLFFIRIDL